MTHFIGHEGKGSMLSYLKRRGWVNYLQAGMSHGSAGFDFAKVTVDLTPEGLRTSNSELMSSYSLYIRALERRRPCHVQILLPSARSTPFVNDL